MKTFDRTFSLPLAVVSATLTMGAPTAQADNLFQLLFGGGIRQERRYAPEYGRDGEYRDTRRQAAPAQAPARRAAPAATPVKIPAPSYYNYKVDSLRRVDFAALAAITQSASLDQATGSTAFREAVSALQDYELMAEADIAKAIVAHYKANPEFIWVSGDAIAPRAGDALRVLADASSYGLTPSEYGVSMPASDPADLAARRAELMRFEMALSARILRYVRDAGAGRVDPNRLSGYHDLPVRPIDLTAALKAASTSDDTRAWLEGWHPQSAEYAALRVELEALRASADDEIVIDPKLLLKPGGTSTELPKLLTIIARDLDDKMGGEFGELLSRSAGTETYSDDLVPLIKAAQTKAGLKADGVIGPRTVQALAGTPKADRIEKVVVALEQLRWLPHELGGRRVFINQPAFTASYFEDDVEKLKMRTVIGLPSNQTSFFYDEIEQVDYNPYWGVPQSIIVNEMLPRLRSDPGYLDRAGYEVTDRKGNRVSSSSIDWGAYGANVPYNVRQTPSEANALGELKILFPNKHAIYMHDTPQKALFNRDTRAFSHGCIRLQDPRGMAAAVLGKSVDYVAAKLARGHSAEKVPVKIPVYVAYFTAWPDSAGTIEYFGDIYDRDSRLILAMEKTESVRQPSS